MAIFAIFLVAYLLLPIFPGGGFADLLDVFEEPTVNFIFLIVAFLSLALLLTIIFHVFWCVASGKKSGALRIGEIMVSEGFITPEDLQAALREQALTLGEFLVASKRLKPEQRDFALKAQKRTKRRIGEILKQLGYATQEDIDWAIKQMERRLGEILKDKQVVSDYDLTCALSLNDCRINANGKIVVIK